MSALRSANRRRCAPGVVATAASHVLAFARVSALAVVALYGVAQAQDTVDASPVDGNATGDSGLTTETGIRLTTDDTEVYVGDSIVLEIASVGLLEPLDTSPLFAGADLLRETTGTRIAVLGGRVVDVRTRRMEFLPREEGTVLFGPLVGETRAGAVRSNGLAVRVLAPVDDDWTPDETDLDVRIAVSDTEPLVGERIVLDIELRHRFAIADERIVLPALDDFDVLAVHERRRTVEPGAGADDGPWRRIAWRYLLWPTRSGSLEIGTLRWSGTMVRSRTRRAPIDAIGQPTVLQVRPAPTDTPGWWLPARAVSLTDSWSRDPRELSAGEQIERTITLDAEGVLASQLPDVVPLATRSLTSLPLGTERSEQLVGETVRARAIYRFRLTARSPVPVFLDTVRVAWWDTANDVASEAIVPARRLNIGLPARADLLAAATRDRSIAARATLVLQSLHVPTALGTITAILLTLAIALTALWPRLRHRVAARHDDGTLPPA